MNNPLYTALNGGAPAQNIAPMIAALQRFRQTFSGDPRQQVQALLNSGKMTQAQYNQLAGMAQQIMQVMK